MPVTQAPIKLVDASEPKITLELPDGSKREIDPWEVAEKIQNGVAAGGGRDCHFTQLFDIIRQSVGLPTQAEIDAVTEGEKPATLSRNACMKLQGAVNRFVEGFEQEKK